MWIDSKLEISVFFVSLAFLLCKFHWESSSDSFWRRKNVWRHLWNNCGNTAALRAEWTGLPLEQRAPPKPTVPAAFPMGRMVPVLNMFKGSVCISEEAQVFFEQTLVFFVRWLIFVHWMILDEIIYSVISMMVSYSSFFLFVAVALLMRRGSTLSESLQKCIPLFEMHLSNNDPFTRRVASFFRFVLTPNSGEVPFDVLVSSECYQLSQFETSRVFNIVS